MKKYYGLSRTRSSDPKGMITARHCNPYVNCIHANVGNCWPTMEVLIAEVCEEPKAIRFVRSEEMKARRRTYGDVGVKFQGKIPDVRNDGCSNTVTSVQKDNLIAMAIQRVGDRDKPSLSVKDIAFTIPANPMSDRVQLIAEVRICALRGRSNGNWAESEHRQHLEIGSDIANSITSVQKDNLIYEELEIKSQQQC